MAGANGSRVQPSPGGTTSRCETSASVGPGVGPQSPTRTPEASRTTSSPQVWARASTTRATASSAPLTEGVATSSRRSSTSAGQVNAKIGRLFLPSHDHGAAAGAGEDLEQQGVGGPAINDMGALDAARRRAHAGFDLGPHAARDGAGLHEVREVIGIGEGHQGRRVVAVAEYARGPGQEDEL